MKSNNSSHSWTPFEDAFFQERFARCSVCECTKFITNYGTFEYKGMDELFYHDHVLTCEDQQVDNVLSE